MPADPVPENSVTREWRVTQRWPDSTPDLSIPMGSEEEARGRQAVLDANTSHPSGYQRRVEVISIESREVGPWRTA